MRSVLSISIPPKKLVALKERAAIKGLTISAYVLQRIDEEEHLISEDELLEDIRIGEKEYHEGKCVVMKSDDDINDFFSI